MNNTFMISNQNFNTMLIIFYKKILNITKVIFTALNLNYFEDLM